MNGTLAQSPSTVAVEAASRWRIFLPVALFSLLWLDLIRQLSYQWSTNEQYAYGWFVPLLALGLFWRKWPTRPRARSPMQSRSSKPVIELPDDPASHWALGLPLPWSGGLAVSWPFLFSLLVAFLALLILPIRLVHEINQDWPLFSWPLTFGVVVISLYAVFLEGGWPWVRHFAFPICFILVAVGWPYRIENGLTHWLMRAVVGITVQVLGWLDVMASQRGNLIELSTGVVGVNEACSGIRSFQSTLMGALFLGELYLLRWPQRLWLLAGGVALSFCFNVVRTLILTSRAAEAGVETVEKWHDPAGLSIFVVSFAGLWLLAAWLRRKLADELEDDAPETPHRPPGPRTAGEWLGSDDTVELVPLSSVLRPLSSALRPLASVFSDPRRFLVAAGCWAVCVAGATELWYRSHEMKPADSAQWWLTYPTNLASFHDLSVPEPARKMLKYDQGVGGAWNEADGTQWSAYCFRWRAGDPTARMSALGHRPEYCLTGSGHELTADLGTREFPANGLDLPFRAYIFDDSRQRLHVFFCLWEDQAEKQQGFGQSKYLDRLRSVWAGRRGLGQQTLEIVMTGYPGISQAEEALRQRLPGLVRIERREPGAAQGQAGHPTI